MSNSIIFASSPKALLHHPQVPTVYDEQRIADYLVANPLPGEKTFYKAVYRLLQGHILTVSVKAIRCGRYWKPENLTELDLASDTDYVDAFKEVLFQAVNDRLRSNRDIGIMLSGGLDSGSVACIAARLLREKNKQLYAYSSVPLTGSTGLQERGRFGDETPYIRLIEQREENLVVTYERSESVSPLTGMKEALKKVGYPFHSPINMYWIEAILKRAKEDGMGVILNGQMGNFTISWAGNRYLSSLLRCGKLAHLWREFIKAASMDGRKLLNMSRFLSQTIRPLVDEKLLNKVRRGQYLSGSYAKHHFAGATKAKERLWQTLNAMRNGSDPRANRNFIFLTNEISDIWSAHCANFNLSPRDPTADRRVMELCLSIPEEQYYRNGNTKMLVRRAMSGILPHRLLWNTEKGRQAADIHARMINANEWGETRSIINGLEYSEKVQSYLDIDRMKRVVDEESSNSGAISFRGKELTLHLIRVHFFLRSLLVGIFLMGENQSNA
jgi:asparagine synthase (glutamine-hydrolysing)